MPRLENIETYGRIFGNGIRQTSNPIGGVDQENWVFNSDTQNYDYIGKPDADSPTQVSPKQPMEQETSVIKEIAHIR